MMMLEFVDQGYKVPYDPSVRSKRQFPKQPDFEGFPRRPNSVKPLLYPQTGLHQEVRFCASSASHLCLRASSLVPHPEHTRPRVAYIAGSSIVRVSPSRRRRLPQPRHRLRLPQRPLSPRLPRRLRNRRPLRLSNAPTFDQIRSLTFGGACRLVS